MRVSPWKNKSIRNNLRIIKAQVKMAIHKWMMSLRIAGGEIPALNKLNIGCGGLIRDGWTNVDLFPGKGAHYVDASNSLPFSDNAFNHIHCEHFLEHLDKGSAVYFLTECFRVLNRGGILRLIVPDTEKYLKAYVNNDSQFFSDLKYLGGAQEEFITPCEVINQMFRMGGDHLYAWDYETLNIYLKKAGFQKISRSDKDDIDREYRIDGEDSWRMIESLYINVKK